MEAKELFNKYLSIFIVPLLLLLYAIFLIATNQPGGFADIIGGVLVAFSILTFALCLIFIFLNAKFFHIRLNWWKNLVTSIIFFAILYLILVISARM